MFPKSRKTTATIVRSLSVITLLLACLMIYNFIIVFNDAGTDTDLGGLEKYVKVLMLQLLPIPAIAALVALCGMCLLPQRNCAVIFGCTLFPAVIIISSFGL